MPPVSQNGESIVKLPAMFGFVLLATVFLGCGSQSTSNPESSSSAAPTEPSATTQPASEPPIQRLNGIELNSLDSATLADLAAGASEYQLRLLEDGKLTLQEYERAKLDEIACLRAQGVVVDDDVRLNGLYIYHYTYSSGASLSKAEEPIRNCAVEFADVIGLAWSIVIEPVTQDVALRSRAWALECLRQEGVALEDVTWQSSDPGIQSAYRRCVQETQATFDLGILFFGVTGDENFR